MMKTISFFLYMKVMSLLVVHSVRLGASIGARSAPYDAATAHNKVIRCWLKPLPFGIP